VGVVAALGGGGAPSARAVAGDSVGAISPSGGAITSDVPVGSSPSAMASGAGAVWVSNYNAGTVSRIDPATRALVQTIQSGSTPSGIAVGAGAVWVANNFADTVSRIDPAVDRVVQTIPVGNAPSGVAVGNGAVWVSNSSDGTLSRIAAATGTVRNTIALGGDPTGLAAGLGALWVSDSADGRVLRVDPLTDQVAQSISVGTGPSAITVGYGSVWVANSLDGTVSRIDPRTDQVAATIPVGNGPSAIAPGIGGVWVANEFGESVSRVDPATNAVAQTVALAGRPDGLAVATGLVWVSAQDAGTHHKGGTLSVMSSGGFGSLDPASPNVQIPSALMLPMTNDGLTAFRRAGGSDGTQLVPDLAVSLPAPIDGGTTYTFQLRRGIRYSNGQSVRPEDFLRAFERLFALEAGVNSPGYLYEDLEGGAVCIAHRARCDLSRAIVIDDRANAITFHLVGPDPEFLDKLAGVAVVAVPANTPLRDLGTQPLPATGPYEIASDTRREVRFVRNPYFREWSHAAQPAGYPDQIIWRIGASPEAAVTAVEHGRADYTLDPPPADRLNEVQTRFASQLHVNPSDLTVGWTVNTRVAPFNNLNVRRALNDAVDRTKIAAILGQDSRPTCQLLPPYIPGYRPYCPYTSDANAAGVWRAPDLAKARALIAASRTRGARITVWSQGAPPIITSSAADAISRYLVALLDRLGYRATLKIVALSDTSYQPWDSRQRIQDSLGFEFAAYPAASQLLGPPYTSCTSFVPASPDNANVPELCDHQLDTTVRRALAAETAGSPTATALWTRADRRLTNDAPAVELATPSTTDLVSHRVGDYLYNPQQESVLIDQLWVH
jgi:YVTN family beta-propeller protein